MYRPTRLKAAAVVAAAALTLAGCTAADSPEPGSPEETPAASGSGSEQPADGHDEPEADDHADVDDDHAGEGDEHADEQVDGPDAAGEWPMQVYFVAGPPDAPRLVPQVLQVTVAHGQSKAAAGVLAAIDGAATDPDYASAWVKLGAQVEGVEVSQSTDPKSSTPTKVVVTLARDLAKTSPRPLVAAALQQLAYTAGAVAGGPAEASVRVGEAKPGKLAGVPASRVTMAPADRVLAPLSVLNLDEGYAVSSPVRVDGMANVPEATVVWQLKRGKKVVKRGFTSAAEAFRMAPYTFTVDAEPGTYTLVVSATDPSGGEGRAPWSETKTITVVE